jgi:hypothetical protein
MERPRHRALHRLPSWVPGARARATWERSDLAPLPWVIALVVIYAVAAAPRPPAVVAAPIGAGQVGDVELPVWAQELLERRE